MKKTIRLAATLALATLTTSQLLSVVSREDACAIIQVSLEENTAALNIALDIISRYPYVADFPEDWVDRIIFTALDRADWEAASRQNNEEVNNALAPRPPLHQNYHPSSVSIAEACSRAESGLQEATQTNAEERQRQAKESRLRNDIKNALNQPNSVDLLSRMFISLSVEDGRRAHEIYLEEEARRDAERSHNR